MKVFVTGATGFVGSEIVRKLLAAGHEAICLVRPGSDQKLITKIGSNTYLRLHPGDLHDLTSLAKGMAGCDAVIHLVGIIREIPAKNVTFARVHVEGTQNMLNAAQNAKIKQFIHMSALGARQGATSHYHQSKYAAEQLVVRSGIPYTIFRPSVIFGSGDEFVNMLAGIVRLPLTPVIGHGQYLLQPVSRDTVADVFIQSLTNEGATNHIFEAGGPDQISYVQILDSIGKAIRKSRVRKIHIPLPLMKPVINLLEGFSFFPITNTQLTMLLEGNTCEDTETLYKTFDTPKVEFQTGIEHYLR